MATATATAESKTPKINAHGVITGVITGGFHRTINVPIRATADSKVRLRTVERQDGSWTAEYHFEGPMAAVGAHSGPASEKDNGFPTEAECVIALLTGLTGCLKKWRASKRGSRAAKNKVEWACEDLETFISTFAAAKQIPAREGTPAGIAANDADAQLIAQIKIDPEFRDLLSPLARDEREQLRQNLLRDGCLDALIVWNDEWILLDGHNRKEICDELLLPYRIERLCFPDRKTALAWALAHQRGRRGGWKHEQRYLRGKQAIAEARPTGRKKNGRQNGTHSAPPEKTAVSIARRSAVSPRTVERDKTWAKALDRLTAAGGSLVKRDLLKGSVKMSPAVAAVVAKMPVGELADVAGRMQRDKVVDVANALPRAAQRQISRYRAAQKVAPPTVAPTIGKENRENFQTIKTRLKEIDGLLPRVPSTQIARRRIVELVEFVEGCF